MAWLFTLASFAIGAAAEKGWLGNPFDLVLGFSLLFIAVVIVGLSSLGGLLFGLAYQKWLKKSRYGILFRNTFSSMVPIALTLIGYTTLFGGSKPFREERKKESLGLAFLAIFLFFCISEALRYYRDHRAKTLSTEVTLISSMLHGSFTLAIYGLFWVSLVQAEEPSTDGITASVIVLAISIIIGLISGLISGVFHKFLFAKTKRPITYRNIVLALLIVIITVIFLSSKGAPKFSFWIGCIASIIHILMVEGMRAYYCKLLAAENQPNQDISPSSDSSDPTSQGSTPQAA